VALVNTQSAMMSWYARFRQVYPEAPAAVEVIKTLNAKPPLDQWLNYLKARCMLDDPASVQEGLGQLQAMLAPSQAAELRLDICRVVGAAQINAGRWNDALETCKVGLSIAPNDAMFNNNLAFIIADKLSKPAEALPYAEKAVEASPDNHAVLDTLAAVQW